MYCINYVIVHYFIWKATIEARNEGNGKEANGNYGNGNEANGNAVANQ